MSTNKFENVDCKTAEERVDIFFYYTAFLLYNVTPADTQELLRWQLCRYLRHRVVGRLNDNQTTAPTVATELPMHVLRRLQRVTGYCITW